MNRVEVIYSKGDEGCYIDGATGIVESASKLKGLIEDLTSDQDLLDRLARFDLSDDHCEFDEGTEILQLHTVDELYWEWTDSDLLLVVAEDLGV